MSCNNELPEGTLKNCPRFVEFNGKSCCDLSNRYGNHNKNRSRCIKKCVDDTLFHLSNISFLSTMISDNIPIFNENKEILSSSIHEMDYQINKSYTVQAHKCKKQIKTYQEFSKKANNRQDQNSWKVSGQYFYAPYIYAFIKFIKKQYIPLIIGKIDKREIIKLCGIIFAVKLLKCLVKFERAKEKPLIRDRTLVNSTDLHQAFKKLHPLFNVPRFYLIEKAKRKKIKKKIVSQKFHHDVGEFGEYLLEIQRKLVINPNYNINYNNNDIMNRYNFPKDWISDNIKDENKENEADEIDDEEDEFKPLCSASMDNHNDDDDDDDEEMEIDEEEQDNEDIDTLNSGSITYNDDDDDVDNNIGSNMIDIVQYNDNNYIYNKNKKYYHNQQEISNELDPVTIRMDLPPPIHIFTNNNYNNNHNIDDGDDNNTQYTDSTGHSHNSYNPQHHNNNNGEYQSIFTEHNEGYISNGSIGSNHSHRSFQNTNNFPAKNINKTGFIIQRNRKLEQEQHIKQMRERRFVHNQQQQQQQWQNKPIPRMPITPRTPSTPFEANCGYNNNNNNITMPTSPITPSTPTITINNNNNNNNINYNHHYHHHHHHHEQQTKIDNPFPVQPTELYNHYNNNNNNCNQSVSTLFISNNNERDNGFKLEFNVTSPTSIDRVGSDTIMNGNVHTNDMGYSFNTNH